MSNDNFGQPEKLMGEPEYNDELINLLVDGLRSEKLSDEDADKLVKVGYIEVHDGKFRIPGCVWSVIIKSPTVEKYQQELNEVEEKVREEEHHEWNMQHFVDRYIRGGELLKVGDVYRITERGYRGVARQFRWWLVHSGNKRRLDYDSPPTDFELLKLDGCKESQIDDAMMSRVGYKQYYWQRLRNTILETLSPDELFGLGIAEKKSRKLPTWYSDLLKEAIKDNKDNIEDRYGAINPLADETWGRKIKK
jgi:hypothetical protein